MPKEDNYKTELDACQATVVNAVLKFEDDGWVPAGTQKGIAIYTKVIKINGANVTISKGVGRVSAAPEVVREIWGDVEHRNDWDEMFNQGRLVEKVNETTIVSYYAANAPWPVTGRDMVFATRFEYKDDGEIWGYNVSVDREDIPETNEFVRGNLMFGGCRWRPVQSDPPVTEVTYAVGFNPMGSIPQWVVNSTATKQPLCIAAVEKVVKKNQRAVDRAKARAEKRPFINAWRKRVKGETTDEEKSEAMATSPSCGDSTGFEKVDVIEEAKNVPHPDDQKIKKKKGSASTSSPSSGDDSDIVFVSATEAAEEAEKAPAGTSSSSGSSSAPVTPLKAKKIKQSEFFGLQETPYDDELSNAFKDAILANEQEEEWEFVDNDDGVVLETREEKSPFTTTTKGIGTISESADIVRELFLNAKMQTDWDSLVKSVKVVKEYDTCTRVSHVVMKSVNGSLTRELVLVTRHAMLENGATFVFGRSVDYPKVNKSSSRVRVEVPFTYAYIKPLGDEMCKITYVISVVDSASDSKPFAALALKRAPLAVKGLRDVAGTKKAAKAAEKSAKSRKRSLNKIKYDDLDDVYEELQVPGSPVIPETNNSASSPSTSTSGTAASTGAAAAGVAAVASSESATNEEKKGEEKKESGGSPAMDLSKHNILYYYKPPPCDRYDAVLKKAYKRAYDAIHVEDGWNKVDRMEEVDIYLKQEAGSQLNECKGVGEIDFPANLVKFFFTYLDWKKLWDEMLDFGEKVEAVDHATGVSYFCFKAPWPVKQRDILLCGRTRVFEDGTFFVYSTSCTHAEKPAVKKYIRSDLNYGSIFITPKGPNKCVVKYATASDPKGSLPKWLVNAANVKTPLCIAKVRDLMTSRPDLVEEARVLIQEADNAAALDVRTHMAIDGAQDTRQPPIESKSASGSSGASAPGGTGDSKADEDDENDEVDAATSSKYDELLEGTYKAALDSVESELGWKFETMQQGVDVYTKQLPGSEIISSKGIGIVNAPAEIVFSVFTNSAVRPHWDEMFKKGGVVKKVDKVTSIVYEALKAPWPVSARDYVLLVRSTKLSDGSIFVYSRSLDENLVPEEKQFVRANMIYSALHIQPLTSSSCRVTYSLASDPRGSLPKYLINLSNVKQPLCIAAVADLIRRSPRMVHAIKHRIDTEKANEQLGVTRETRQAVETPWIPEEESKELVAFRAISKKDQWMRSLRAITGSEEPIQVGVLVVKVSQARGLAALTHALRQMPLSSLKFNVTVSSVQLGDAAQTFQTKNVVVKRIKSDEELALVKWDENFSFPVYNPCSDLIVHLNAIADGETILLAELTIPLPSLQDQRRRIGWHALAGPHQYRPEDQALVQINSYFEYSRAADFAVEFTPQLSSPSSSNDAKSESKKDGESTHAEARPYDPQRMADNVMRLSRVVEPIFNFFSTLSSVRNWDQPAVTGIFILILLLCATHSWIIPFVLFLAIGWQLAFDFAENRFQLALHGTPQWVIQKRARAAARDDLAAALKKHYDHPLADSGMGGVPDEQLYKRTMAETQQSVVFVTEQLELVTSYFNWTDPEATFVSCVVVLLSFGLCFLIPFTYLVVSFLLVV